MLLALLLALSLSEARALADARNLAYAASRAELGVARAGVDAAGQLPNPTLNTSYGADDPRFLVGLDVKLPFFGQRSAAVRTAEAAVHVSEAENEVARVALHAAVRRVFAAHWAAREQAQVAEQSLQIARDLARMTRSKFDTGGAPQLEVEQTALAAQRAEYDLADRTAEVEATRRELSASTGADIAEVSAPPPVDVPALDELRSRAFREHPELQSLRAQEETALARVHQEKNAIVPLPIVTVTAERFWEQSPTWGARVGVAFDLPILSQNSGRVREQEEAAHKAELLAQARAQRIEGQLGAARARWAAAADRARFYSGSFVSAAEKVLEMSQAGYRIGRTSLLAVLQAQSELSAAKGRAIDATLEAQRALADLEEAVGADF
jgi:cobalt-zinc-cadmium efflux system outer membrane protein